MKYIYKRYIVSLGPCPTRVPLTLSLCCCQNPTWNDREHTENEEMRECRNEDQWVWREWVVLIYEYTSMRGHRPQVPGLHVAECACAQNDHNNMSVSDVRVLSTLRSSARVEVHLAPRSGSSEWQWRQWLAPQHGYWEIRVDIY